VKYAHDNQGTKTISQWTTEIPVQHDDPCLFPEGTQSLSMIELAAGR
jgi:hypothetical protein